VLRRKLRALYYNETALSRIAIVGGLCVLAAESFTDIPLWAIATATLVIVFIPVRRLSALRFRQRKAERGDDWTAEVRTRERRLQIVFWPTVAVLLVGSWFAPNALNVLLVLFAFIALVVFLTLQYRIRQGRPPFGRRTKSAP
jgi:hypothetical protein